MESFFNKEPVTLLKIELHRRGLHNIFEKLQSSVKKGPRPTFIETERHWGH